MGLQDFIRHIIIIIIIVTTLLLLYENMNVLDYIITKWWHSVVVSSLALISVVNRYWAWLALGWVTVLGR